WNHAGVAHRRRGARRAHEPLLRPRRLLLRCPPRPVSGGSELRDRPGRPRTGLGRRAGDPRIPHQPSDRVILSSGRAGKRADRKAHPRPHRMGMVGQYRHARRSNSDRSDSTVGSLKTSSLTGLSAPDRPADHLRLGAGAGFAGDRLDPAIALAEHGNLDFLIFELLGERTVAAAQRREREAADSGFEPTLIDRITSVAEHCAANGTRIVTNGGAANPKAAARAVAEAVRGLGIEMPIAYVTGDDVLGVVDDVDPDTWE